MKAVWSDARFAGPLERRSIVDGHPDVDVAKPAPRGSGDEIVCPGAKSSPVFPGVMEPSAASSLPIVTSSIQVDAYF